MERRLAAILSADVVGYSRLIEEDEAGTLAALRERRKEIIEPTVAEHRGRIVKLMGDGVLVEFASAVQAVECAVEMQRLMAAADDGGTGKSIVFRMGINLGDVVVEDNDLYGDGVNVAARLQAMAEPGRIWVSGNVHDEVERKLNLGFDDLGRREIKNITRPVQIFRIAGEIAVPRSDSDSAATKPSIAVLPFTNMSGDPEQQYFSDGITEDIITELSRFRSLFVIARNSSFQYRDKNAVDVRRVAQELGVRYVLEGSVRKMGERVRITAQLIDASTGNHLWSERYDRDLSGLFEVQDEVTRTIVATLVGRLEDAEIRGAARKPTESPAAYDDLLQGIELIRGYGDGNNRRARELFERAVSLDPCFALAHAYLALALLVEHRYDAAPASIKDQALEAGLTAVRLEPREGRCHQFLAQVYRYRGEFDLAISHFEQSRALNINDSNGLAMMGSVLGMAGRAAEGVGLIREAILLNPFHPDWYWSSLAVAAYAAHDYEEALAANRRLPAAYWPLARAAACLAQLGRLDEARAQALEVLKFKADFHLAAEKLVYKNAADAEHVLDGMRRAGLPE